MGFPSKFVARLHRLLQDMACEPLLSQLPSIALLWRLPIVREVVLSGFQLELYSEDERSFAYWYAAQVMEAHLQCLDNIFPMTKEGSEFPMKHEATCAHSLLVQDLLCSARCLIRSSSLQPYNLYALRRHWCVYFLRLYSSA